MRNDVEHGVEAGKELRCYDCGYRGDRYIVGNDFSPDEGASSMCPRCRGWGYEIEDVDSPYDAVVGWKRMKERREYAQV